MQHRQFKFTLVASLEFHEIIKKKFGLREINVTRCFTRRNKNALKIGNCLSKHANFRKLFCYSGTFYFYCCCVLIILLPIAAGRVTNNIVQGVENSRNKSENEIFIDDRNGSIDLYPMEIIRVAASLVDSGEQEKNPFKHEKGIDSVNGSGKYVGDRCEVKCSSELQHVVCDVQTYTCSCERSYPVVIDLEIGCGKAKKLGEQCFYHEACRYNDENSLCVQVSHNALCQCGDGFHSVSYSKPVKRVFCTQDIAVLTSNLPTLLGVTTGIAVLAGLICMVLHLFSKTKYPRHRNFGDANIPPPVMYSSDTGIPLSMQSARPSSRSSMRSNTSAGSYGNRRSSSSQEVGPKGVLVSTSRTGAARSAAILLISCHISAISKKNCNAEGSCDNNMTLYLQKQLQHQKQLLHLELPSNISSNKLRAMLGINEIEKDDADFCNLENESQIGALPTPASETARFAVLDDQV